MRNRNTIARPVEFSGVGIHSGKTAEVRISPLPDGGGIRFRFGDDCYGIEEARLSDTRRKTGLAFPNGSCVFTVEHLLASLVGLEIDDAEIEIRGEEVPVIDGSALPFATALIEAGIQEREETLVVRSLFAPVAIDSGRASIVALPSDDVRMTYVIDYSGTAIGTQIKDVVLTRESFMNEIAPARTFGLRSEVEALQREGLGLGGDLDNVIIIGDDGPLNTVGYRVEQECVSHKILDLMGDLTLLGFPVTAHYICICGGHDIHAKLVDRLKSVFIK